MPQTGVVSSAKRGEPVARSSARTGQRRSSSAGETPQERHGTELPVAGRQFLNEDRAAVGAGELDGVGVGDDWYSGDEFVLAEETR